jgi:hypothetical protein
MRDHRNHRLVLRPRYERQYQEFGAALDQVWRQGGWTLGIDEYYYLDYELKLRLPINRLLTQGREPGKISVVTGMQRPSIVSRFALGEATHVICFAVEGRDAKILRDATNQTVADVAATLPRHHFLWYYAPERSVWSGKLNLATGNFNGRIAA